MTQLVPSHPQPGSPAAAVHVTVDQVGDMNRLDLAVRTMAARIAALQEDNDRLSQAAVAARRLAAAQTLAHGELSRVAARQERDLALARTDLAAARAELGALRGTRTFRYTAAPRGFYARLRGRLRG